MISDSDFKRIAVALPVLRHQDSALDREFRQKAFLARIPAGREVFAEGDRPGGVALLLSGVVRVYKIGDTGREITLYRFGHGESCILTASTVLNRQSFPAFAVVEEEAEAVMVPADDFRDWVHRHEPWRSFVFDLLSQRLSSVIELIDEVTFRRMDARIAAFLIERAGWQNPVPITHQAIASELGSSREVVSRILEGFAAQGMIRPSRGSIEVSDFEALRKVGD
jgi:CRP/FNR family transcriptional regulator, anaerobic regulatory protein